MQQNAMNTLSVYKLQQYKGHDGGGVSVFVADAAVCHKDCVLKTLSPKCCWLLRSSSCLMRHMRHSSERR